MPDITPQEIKTTVASSASAQLASIADVLKAAGIDVEALARAIGAGAACTLGLRLGLLGDE